MLLLHPNTELRLNQAKGLKVGRTDIPNTSSVIADSLPTLKAFATAIGIDFEATKFTFTVKATEWIDRTVFSPQIGNIGGVPHLLWGRVAKPLSELPTPDFAQAGGMFAVFYVEALDEPVEIRVRAARDVKASELKAAYNKGNLADKLDRLVVPALPLADLCADKGEGTYTFTGYDVATFQNGSVVSVNVKGVGWVKANTTLAKALSSAPVVTEEQPATFGLRDTGKAKNGYKIFDTNPIHFSSITEDDLSDLGVNI